MKTRIFGIAAALVLVVAGLAIVHWKFGSLANAAAYADGKAVRVDQPVQDLGVVEPQQAIKITFNVTNLQGEPLRIVGANSTCSCVLPPEVPLTLQPLVATPLALTFFAPEAGQPFEQKVSLYLDGPLPAVKLAFRGVTR